jgi:DNA-binding response OmpR family regulator
MKATRSILIISRDRVLQSTRRLILEHAGYYVSSAHTEEEAIQLVGDMDSYSLVLLCHSVPETARVPLVNKIKTLRPALPILMLYNSFDPTMAKIDSSVSGMESPGKLIDMIGRLMRGDRAASAD